MGRGQSGHFSGGHLKGPALIWEPASLHSPAGLLVHYVSQGVTSLCEGGRIVLGDGRSR